MQILFTLLNSCDLFNPQIRLMGLCDTQYDIEMIYHDLTLPIYAVCHKKGTLSNRVSYFETVEVVQVVNLL